MLAFEMKFIGRPEPPNVEQDRDPTADEFPEVTTALWHIERRLQEGHRAAAAPVAAGH